MNSMNKDIIDQIRLERKKQGITQTELANLLGCPQPSIWPRTYGWQSQRCGQHCLQSHLLHPSQCHTGKVFP